MLNHYKILSKNKLGQSIIFALKSYLNDKEMVDVHIGEIACLSTGAIALLVYVKDKTKKNILRPILNTSLLKVETNNFKQSELAECLKDLEPYIRISR